MTAFDEWWDKFDDNTVGRKWLAEQAFKAGMTRAAEICKDVANGKPFDNSAGSCIRGILAARDGK